jgi:hypothetical protein
LRFDAGTLWSYVLPGDLNQAGPKPDLWRLLLLVAATSACAPMELDDRLFQSIALAPSGATKVSKKPAPRQKRMPFTHRLSIERRKHNYVRRALGLVGSDGAWMRSLALQSSTLPILAARCLDILHILYLVFEHGGIDPSTVDQVWSLDQSVYRGAIEKRKSKWLNVGVRLSVPGYHPSGDERVCPCVCPKGLLWFNATRRILTGECALRLQGVPTWRFNMALEENQLLSSLAGNGFAMPVLMAHLVVAFVRVLGLPLAYRPAPESGSPREVEPSILEFTNLSSFLCKLLLGQPIHAHDARALIPVTVGSLCSGADFLPHAAKAVGAALGVPSTSQTISCERDPAVRAFRQRHTNVDGAHCYNDVTSLPESAPACDILAFGSSCKGLSFLNNDRHDLLDVDFQSEACTSGNTMRGCLTYIQQKKPRVVIAENVKGLLAKASNGKRNVEVLLEGLRANGYACDFGVVDARDFFLPQSRSRVYVWAERIGGHGQLGENGCLSQAAAVDIGRHWTEMLSHLKAHCSHLRVNLHTLLQHSLESE